MKTYVGVKSVKAEPMTRGDYNTYREWQIPAGENPADPGYLILYPDGYVSWSPKAQFEAAYLELCDTKSGLSGEIIDRFIRTVDDTKMGEKSTVVLATCRTGFEIVEQSSSVRASDFDQSLGRELALQRVRDRLWGLLGFVVQWGRDGL